MLLKWETFQRQQQRHPRVKFLMLQYNKNYVVVVAVFIVFFFCFFIFLFIINARDKVTQLSSSKKATC